MSAKKQYRIAVIPGDGIGKEVMPEGVRVLEAAAKKHGVSVHFDHFDFASWDYYEKHGEMMPEDWKAKIGKHDAIYFGAVGMPAQVPDHISLWGSLLLFRREFDQYVNLRPVRLMPGVPSPLANRKPGDLAEAAVAGLADIPDAIHRRVNAYMDAWSPSAGIYVTRGQMVDFVPELRAIANEHPRGYAEGKTWRDSGGLHSQSENLIAVGTPRGETGSEQRYYSTAQHEMGHALDSSMGFPSRQPQWREQVLKLADSPQLSVNPYYRADGNPYGWDSEAFAQALHGWANGLKQRREGARVYAMLDAFGFFRRDYTKYPYEQDFDPPLLEAAQHMIRFFDQAAGVN